MFLSNILSNNLSKYLSYNTKVLISVFFAGLWIYFRTNQCYIMLPRMNIFSVIFVMIWAYLNYYEPLFLPIGLGIMLLYFFIHKEEMTTDICEKTGLQI